MLSPPANAANSLIAQRWSVRKLSYFNAIGCNEEAIFLDGDTDKNSGGDTICREWESRVGNRLLPFAIEFCVEEEVATGTTSDVAWINKEGNVAWLSVKVNWDSSNSGVDVDYINCLPDV